MIAEAFWWLRDRWYVTGPLVGLVLALLLWAVFAFLHAPFNPIAPLLVLPGIVFLLWFVLDGLGRPAPVAWHRLDPALRSLHADRATEALVSDIEKSSQGADVAGQNVARHLLQVARGSLIAAGANPDDPLDDAEERLSPRLVQYLRDVDAGQFVAPLKSTRLSAYLKELQSL